VAMYVDQPGSDADGKSMAALGAQAAQDDRAAAEEGGFEVDAEDMAERVKELQDLYHEKMFEIRELAEPLTNVEGLGGEPVSRDYLHAVNASGESYKKFVDSMDDFFASYIEKMKDTVREYRDGEEQAADDVKGLAIDVDE